MQSTRVVFTLIKCLVSCLLVEGWSPRLNHSYIHDLVKPGWGDDSLGYDVPQPNNNDSLSNVHFYLWTRNNPTVEQELQPFNSESILNSSFNFALNTHILYHGYDNHGLTEYIQDMKSALLRHCNCNVVSVDYQLLVYRAYGLSVINTYRVAELSAAFIDWLVEEFKLDLKRTVITGHSLGGQTTGMTGHYLRTGTVARITALDPAGPLYYQQDDSLMISKESAEFVDIIHTNACPLKEGCFGLRREVGHVDFYPNGGTDQPGCTRYINGSTDGDVGDIDNCSHHRSVLYWTESVNAQEPRDRVFWSRRCPDLDAIDKGDYEECRHDEMLMGLPSAVRVPGVYYLRTAAQQPFALGVATTLHGASLAGSVAALSVIIFTIMNFRV